MAVINITFENRLLFFLIQQNKNDFQKYSNEITFSNLIFKFNDFTANTITNNIRFALFYIRLINKFH